MFHTPSKRPEISRPTSMYSTEGTIYASFSTFDMAMGGSLPRLVLMFLPGHHSCASTISYLTREERVSWVDRMLLPAIRQVCLPHVIQHHPQSFDDAESKTYSGLQESCSGMVRSGIDAHNHTPLEYLEEIWVEIARHAEHADLAQFRGMYSVEHEITCADLSFSRYQSKILVIYLPRIRLV